jgi:kynureninase
MTPPYLGTPEEASRLDAADPLAHLRAHFYLPEGQIYLDGNSLGLLSRESEAATLKVLDQWKRLAVDGWTRAEPPWFSFAEELSRLLAPLVGAAPEEVIAANSTTVNLHQLLATLFQPQGRRTKLLIDSLAFPSDSYAVRSHLRLRGLEPAAHLVVVPSRDGLTLDEDEILAAMTAEVHTAVLPSVVYTSGQLLDMERLAAGARQRGVLLGLDCSHSIGALPHRLSEWGVDFAFWCHYKYLNSGPGGAGGLFLHRRHFGRAPGLAGWWGSDKSRQFDMAPEITPAAGAGALQIGTPSILSLAPLQGALELVTAAGIAEIRQKSLRQTEYLMALADTYLSEHGFTVANPREPERRGGHVALAHPEAARIARALKDAAVVPDYRPPHIVRLAPVAHYTTFAECLEAVQRLRTIIQTRAHERYPPARDLIP